MPNKPVHVRCPTCLKKYSRSVRVKVLDIVNLDATMMFQVICDGTEHHKSVIEIEKARR